MLFLFFRFVHLFITCVDGIFQLMSIYFSALVVFFFQHTSLIFQIFRHSSIHLRGLPGEPSSGGFFTWTASAQSGGLYPGQLYSLDILHYFASSYNVSSGLYFGFFTTPPQGITWGAQFRGLLPEQSMPSPGGIIPDNLFATPAYHDFHYWL